MKRGNQKQIAKWIGINESFLSRILNDQKRPKPIRAVGLEEITGISMRDWLLLPGGQLRRMLNDAWKANNRKTTSNKKEGQK